jgi:hypothetical protein
MYTYGNLEDKLLAIVLSLKRVENGRELSTIELDCSIVSNGLAISLQTCGKSAVDGLLTVDDGTDDLRTVGLARSLVRVGYARATGMVSGAARSHLVNLAGANAGSARPSAGDGKSESGRSEGTSRKDGRASRAGEGGNAAAEGKTQWSAQLGFNWNGKVVEKTSTVASAIVTHLLNILPDDKERSEIGVERGWLKLRRTFTGGEQFCSGGRLGRLELSQRGHVKR